MSNAKFEKNRNKFRRVYAYGSRNPPILVTYVDSATNTQHQRDFNQIVCDDTMFGVVTETNNSIPTLYTSDFTTFATGALVGVLPHNLGFQRATAETVQTSATTIVTGVGINIPRFGNDGIHQGMVFEESRTNVFVNNRTPASTSAGYNVAGTVINIGGQRGPDGTNNATNLQVASGANALYQTKTLPVGNYSYSAWITTPITGVSWQLSQAGITTNGNGTWATGSLSSTDTIWHRYNIPLTASVTDTPNLIIVDGRGNGTFVNSPGGDTPRNQLMDFIQVETGSFPTEAIITPTNANVTRAGERLYQPNGNSWIDSGRLGLEIKLQPKGSSISYGNNMRLWTDTNNSSQYCELDKTNNKITVSANGITYITPLSLTFNQGDTVQIWIAAGDNTATDCQYTVNGGGSTVISTGFPVAFGGIFFTGALDLLCNGTNNQFTSWVQQINVYRNGQKPVWAR